MSRYVLDASAILRMTDGEAGATRVRDLFHAAARGEAELFISAVNWGEVIHALHRKNPKQALVIQSKLSALPLEVVEVDKDNAEDAAMIKVAFNIPYADAFAASLTQVISATGTPPASLVTADYDFKSLPKGTLRIEFLPAK